MENLKHEKAAEIVLDLFKDCVRKLRTIGVDFYAHRANAYLDVLCEIGYTEQELYEIADAIKKEIESQN